MLYNMRERFQLLQKDPITLQLVTLKVYTCAFIPRKHRYIKHCYLN